MERVGLGGMIAGGQLERALGNGRRAAAEVIDQRMQRRHDGAGHWRDRSVAPDLGIDDMVRRIDDRDIAVVEQRAEPGGEPRLHQAGRLLDVAGADRDVRLDDVLEAAQRPFAVVGDCPGQKLLLARDRNLVGALRRGERRNHDADDRDCHHGAKRDQHAKPRRSQPVGLAFSRVQPNCEVSTSDTMRSAKLPSSASDYLSIIAIGFEARAGRRQTKQTSHFMPRS